MTSSPAIVCMCTQFGIDSWCHFPFRVRTHRPIHTDKITDTTADWPAYVAQRVKALGVAVQWAWLAGYFGRALVRLPPLPACRVRLLHAMRLFSGRYRGFACVLFKMWQAITPGLGASGCGESRQCGQQMVGVSGLIGRLRIGTLPEKPAG